MVLAEHSPDRKSQTRVRLLRAMIEAGAAVGYGGSSVRAVIAEAGTARSTFYAHFRDFDACFLAALDNLADTAVGAASERARTAGTPAAVRALVEFAEREPAGAKLLFVQSLAGRENALNRRQQLREEIERCVVPSGQIPPVDSAVIGGVLRLLAMRLRRADPDLCGLGGDLAAWIGCYEAGEFSLPHPSKKAGVLDAGGNPRAEPTRNHQRPRILQATTACSYEYGYRAVRVADITAKARVSRKAFYRQFQNKADAATEANEALFQAALSACAGSFFGSEGWPDRVWAGGSALLAFLAAHPVDAHLGFVETHAIGAEAARHVYDRLEAFTLFLEEGYRYRQEAEALPRSISEALAAVMFELAFRDLRERGDLAQLLESLPLLAYTILAPFMGTEAAAEFVANKANNG